MGSRIYPILPGDPAFTLTAGDIVRLDNLATATIDSTDFCEGIEFAYGRVGNTLFEWNATTGRVTSGRARTGYHVAHIIYGATRWRE